MIGLNATMLGPDRLELIMFDITGKKIDNDPCRLIMLLSANFSCNQSIVGKRDVCAPY